MDLIRPIQIRHRLITLIEKHVGSSQSFPGEAADMLIHSRLRPGQKPQDSFNDEIRYEPA